jgi:predicted TIM-barrel fold metal-dependent hydrolase
MIQNIHAHAWDMRKHLNQDRLDESNLARNMPINLDIRYETFMQDAAPFERVVVFGLKSRRTGTWVPDAWIADFCARSDKLVGFASCDPTQRGYVEELKHAVEGLGLRGLKMGPIYAGFDPRDPICDPVYSYCQENGVPILFHTGTTYRPDAPLGYSRPWLYDEVAIAYPELQMVLAHVGHPWGGECLAVIRKHPHVYADISALYYRPWQFYNTMILAQEYGVTHKLLFGTDYPFAGGQESIDGVRNANTVIGNSGLPRISAELIEEILARDALHLLGIGLA